MLEASLGYIKRVCLKQYSVCILKVLCELTKTYTQQCVFKSKISDTLEYLIPITFDSSKAVCLLVTYYMLGTIIGIEKAIARTQTKFSVFIAQKFHRNTFSFYISY